MINSSDIKRAAIAALFMLLVNPPSMAHSAEIRVLSVPPMRSAMNEIIPQFEKTSGHKVIIDYGTPPQLADRLQRGDAVDVLITTRDLMNKLEREGTTTGAVDVAKVGMGVAVRQGAPKPNIGSVDAFKRILISAKSIAYIDPASGAPGGIYLANLMQRLGIAAELNPKTRHLGPSGAETALAAGEVELALSQITVIKASPGIELAGPLPSEIQNYLQFASGAIAGGKNLPVALNFISFISSPAALAAMKAKGFE